MQQTQSTQEKINLKYASSSAVRPGQTFGYGQVTTGQVSSRKYEILARASSVGRFEDREGLNPEMMMRAQSQSTSARGSPAPLGNQTLKYSDVHNRWVEAEFRLKINISVTLWQLQPYRLSTIHAQLSCGPAIFSWRKLSVPKMANLILKSKFSQLICKPV